MKSWSPPGARAWGAALAQQARTGPRTWVGGVELEKVTERITEDHAWEGSVSP